jgi:hypothetical protein
MTITAAPPAVAGARADDVRRALSVVMDPELDEPITEAQGTANQIRVTDEVRNALAESYVFEGPEIVDVKGKGPTRVWTLIAGRSGEDRDE